MDTRRFVAIATFLWRKGRKKVPISGFLKSELDVYRRLENKNPQKETVYRCLVQEKQCFLEQGSLKHSLFTHRLSPFAATRGKERHW
jgi:hypothetical protein